jgi:hypothetical protein
MGVGGHGRMDGHTQRSRPQEVRGRNHVKHRRDRPRSASAGYAGLHQSPGEAATERLGCERVGEDEQRSNRAAALGVVFAAVARSSRPPMPLSRALCRKLLYHVQEHLSQRPFCMQWCAV